MAELLDLLGVVGDEGVDLLHPLLHLVKGVLALERQGHVV